MADSVTIDWCEENNVVLPFVAEFWNTLTSLICVFPPLVFFFCLRYPDGAGIIPWMHLLISFIMFGSALFHGTLTWFGQLMDEVPILVFISFSFSALLDNCTILGPCKPGSPALPRRRWAPGPRMLAVVGFVQVLAITALYTSHTKVYAVFLGCAVVQALAHWPLLLLELRGRLASVRGPILRMLAAHVVLGYGGYGLWCLENAFCERLRSLHLHAWWHVLATFSMKPFIDLLIFHRLHVSGAKPRHRPALGGWGTSVVLDRAD